MGGVGCENPMKIMAQEDSDDSRVGSLLSD
jgi:hypothetical protein